MTAVETQDLQCFLFYFKECYLHLQIYKYTINTVSTNISIYQKIKYTLTEWILQGI